MLFHGDTQKRWAIILAGGDGRRLSSLTQRIAGDNRPKQFCSLIRDSSLIEQTRSRVSLSIPADHILAVVTRTHERFYEPELRDMRKENLVVQPDNRGTAAAILYSLLRLSKLAPAAYVALFPSDHFVSDDGRFMRHVDLAFDAAALRPELTVLLGITADYAETGYGWIEPSQPIAPEQANVLGVHRFREKPSTDHAKQLLDRGCLWNSFVIVARVSTLMGLIIVALPELYHAFRRISASLMTSSEGRSINRLYGALPHADFSHDVLARNPVNLAVLPVRGVEWSDLGEPARVRGLLARLGIRAQWDAA